MAAEGTAAAAAPGARAMLLLGCFAEPSTSVVVSPCSRQGARLHHAPHPPVARPSRSLTKASSPRAVLSSAVRIYTGKKKGFSFAATEFCSFPPNTPPSGFSTGFAALRNNPSEEPLGHQQQHHTTLSGLLLVSPDATWSEASAAFASGGWPSQTHGQQTRHLLA